MPYQYPHPLVMGSPVVVSKEGDLNKDGVVNIQDILLLVVDFGKTSGFNPSNDLAPSGAIDIFDVMVIVKNFG